MRTFLSAALYFSFTSIASAGSHAFNEWRSQGWKKTNSESVNVSTARQNIDVTFFTDNKNIPSIEMYFDEVAEATYRNLSSKISIGRGSRTGKCYNWRLVVYELSERNLNSRNVMYWYPWRDPSMRIYGAYDSSYRDSQNTAVIIIRNDMPNLKRKQILAHELTHYWFDMCVANGESGENYAQGAESLF